MTDKLKGVWVAFDHDIRVDDAEPILAAIRQIKCVQAVTGSVVNSNADDWMARQRVTIALRQKIYDVLKDS